MTFKEFFSFSWLINLFFKRDSESTDFEFTESMWGYMCELDQPVVFREEVPDFGEDVYRAAYEEGKDEGNKLHFEVTLTVDDLEAFTAPSCRRAPMGGHVTCDKLYGEKLAETSGEKFSEPMFDLFKLSRR